MSITIKILITTLVLIVFVIAGVIIWLMNSPWLGFDSEVGANEYIVNFEEVHEVIYIRARAWGLGGNHQEIIVANSPIVNQHLEYFKDRQMIYLDSTELYYKKVGNDVLEIYVDSKADIPPLLTSKIKIRQIELNLASREFLNKYSDLGFTKVSVYQNEK